MAKEDKSSQTDKTDTVSEAEAAKLKSKTTEASSPLLYWLKASYYAIWSVVGVLIIGLVLLAGLNANSIVDDLTNPQNQTSQQTAPAQAQPSQQQLQCVRDALGKERFEKLQQGSETPTSEETAQIRQCLQS